MQNKRFLKEINIYKNEENCCYISNSGNEAKFVIFLNERYFIEVNILIGLYYPFIPPTILNKDYTEIIYNCSLIKNNDSYFYNYYNKIKPLKNCYQCDSILCKNNWGPSYRISNILKEIKTNLQNNLRVVELIHCKKVMEKYLNCEIPIIYEFI
tara:strand:- start:38 stop:499 length:462 start_codon:yes stop_codon:yes gene_type:complete